MVPELYEAWHAGQSNWKKDISLNKNSIGIEISNKGHDFGYENFSKPQISSLIKLSKYLIKKYKIKISNILGHSDIAFERKKDPGEKFPWSYLANKKIGIWHKIEDKNLKKLKASNRTPSSPSPRRRGRSVKKTKFRAGARAFIEVDGDLTSNQEELLRSITNTVRSILKGK